MKLDFVNKTSQKLPTSEKTISSWVSNELKKHGFDNNWIVEILIVDDSEIRKLNKKHRKIDKVTDVLSFPMYDVPSQKGDDNLLGSIVISVDTIKKQAHDANHTLEKELEKMVRHSTRHLLGKHHK